MGWAMLKAAPAVANGKVFVNGNKTYCLDENTGDIIWSSKFLGGSPVAIATDKVFAVSPSYIYCLKENSGEVIWKHECQGGTAVIANGKVFLGSSICNESGYFNDGIYCFGSKGVFSRGKEAPSEEKTEETREEEKVKEKGIPGFEVLFAIAGLLAVAYILWRNKK